MAYLNRRAWGARPSKLRRLDPARVEGIALHWPGMAKPLAPAAVPAALREWQRMHMDDKGWSDIAYQAAVDQDGNVYTLRGMVARSAANGDEDTNDRFGALLLVLGPREVPSPAMVAATRRLVAKHRQLYPRSTRVVGHQQIRPAGTECPGMVVMAAIRAGSFEPEKSAPKPVPKPVQPVAKLTRGPEVETALAALRRAATGTGKRAQLLATARQALQQIPTYPTTKG